MTIGVLQAASTDDATASTHSSVLNVSLTGITAGSTLVLYASAADKDTGGTNLPVGAPSISDSVNGAWPAALENLDDTTATQRSAGYAFRNAAPLAGATVITATWPANTIAKGIKVFEVGGASATSTFPANGSIQSTTVTDGTTSGIVTPGTLPGLLLAMSFNDNGPPVPTPSTGFTNEGTGLACGQGVGALAQFESKRLTAGAAAATFTCSGTPQTTTIAIFIDEAAAGGCAIPVVAIHYVTA